jgi:hypothetical protein
VEIEIPLERLSDNVILRREPKNLEILRAAQDDNYSLRGVYPELAEGLRMTNQGLGEIVGQPLGGILKLI